MLEEYALLPRSAEPEGRDWPELPAPLRRRARFVVVPPANQTFTRCLVVPPLARAKRERLVRFEAEQAIPRPLAEVSWAWCPTAGQPNTVELAAMKLAAAEKLGAEAGADGVRLEAIVPRAAALERAVRYNYPESGGAVVLAEFAGSMVLLLAVGRGRSEARLVGLPEALVPAGAAPAAGERCLGETALRRLITEVRRMGGESVGEGGGPQALLLAGAEVPPPDEVARALGDGGVLVDRFDALRRVRLGPKANGAGAVAPQLGVAVGAALKVRERRFLNLLPVARQRENAFRRSRKWILGMVGVLAVALGGTTVWLRQDVRRLRHESVVVARDLEPWRMAQREVLELQRQADAAEHELAVIAGLDRARTGWVCWLAAAQRAMEPLDGVWLERLQVVSSADGGAAATGGLFGHAAPATADGVARLRLAITGCALDPGDDGRRGLERVRGLFRAWTEAGIVETVEAERFDPNEAGLLRFGCVLVLKPEAAL